MRDRTCAPPTKAAHHQGDSDPDMDEALRRARTKPAQAVRAILLDVADQLTADEPADPITHTVWTAEVRDAAARRYGDGDVGQAVKLALFRTAPSPQKNQTRGKFASTLRAAAGALR